MRLLNEGDPLASLAWFAEALQLDRNNPDKAFVHQLRLHSVIGQCPQLLQMWFHAAKVNDAVFSPDGALVAAASEDRTVHVWNVETGEPMGPPLRHSGPVRRISFSPDGQRILTAAWKDVEVWNVVTAQRELTLDYPAVEDALFSPDGKKIAAASDSGGVRIYDAQDGREIVAGLRHTTRPNGSQNPGHLAFSPDGHRLLTMSYDNIAKVWNVETGELLFSLPHTHVVRHAQFSPDGSMIATAHWLNTVHLWGAETGRPIFPPLSHGNMVDHVAFSPDGKLLVSVGHTGAYKLWEVETGHLVQSGSGNESLVMGAVFSPDGGRFMTRQFDGRVRVWSTEKGKLVAPPLRHGWWATSARFHPDGHRVLTASSDGSVRLWDLEPRGLQFWPWPSETSLQAIGWSPRRTRVLTRTSAGKLQSWNTQTWQPDGVAFAPASEPMRAFFTPDERRVVLLSVPLRSTNNSSMFRDISVWDLASGTETNRAVIRLEGAAAYPSAVEASLDATQIAFAGDGAVESWDAITGKRARRAVGPSIRVPFLRFNSDGQKICFSSGRLLHVLDLQIGRPALRAFTNNLTIAAAEFSPDGKWLAAVDSDESYRNGMVRVWDTAGGLRKFSVVHEDGVKSVAFSQDSRWLATGGEAKEARVFDVQTGRPVSTRFLHPASVQALAFSHDGRFLATGTDSRAGTAQVWEVATGEPITPPLKHPHKVEDIFFLADDRTLVTRCEDGFRFWNLRVTEPPDMLVTRSRLLAAHMLDAFGAMKALRVNELSNRWNDARSSRAAMAAAVVAPVLSRPVELVSVLIPPRDAGAPENLIDLTDFYNFMTTDMFVSPEPGDNLAELPLGVQTFAGTMFDVRGVVQLRGSRWTRKNNREIPKAVKGIPVEQTLHQLHALLSTGWDLDEGTKIGGIILNYSDGKQAELPIVYGQHTMDWWTPRIGSAPQEKLSNAATAWIGANAATRRAPGRMRRLFRATWPNPRPDVQVESIDLGSTVTRCAPFVVAITVE
jgi:WD40 repeat protein